VLPEKAIGDRCVQLVELSVESLANLGANASGVYVLLSNIYADEGMWYDVVKVVLRHFARHRY
jgi:hypothetical protein